MSRLLGVIFVGFFLVFGVGSIDAARSDIATPTSPSPADGATVEQPVILKWSSVEFPGGVAGGYLAEVSGGNLGTNRKFWVPQNSFDFKDHFTLPSGLIVNAQHLWRVRACFGFDQPAVGQAEEDFCGPWSNNGNTWKFIPTLAKPKLLSPANTTKESIPPPVTLKWENVTGANTYNVEVRSLSLTFPFTKTFDKVVGTSLEITTQNFPLNFNRAFQWKVVPWQGDKPGPASETWEFFVALPKPKLLCPQNGTNVSYPVSEFVAQNEPCKNSKGFTWNAVSGATSYVLEVFDARNARVAKLTIPQAFFAGSITAINKIEEVYSWQVTACEALNKNCGSASNRSNFTLVYAPPLITSPLEDNTEITDLSFKFRWEKPPAPAISSLKYLWEIKDKTSARETDKTEVALVQLKPGGYTFLVKACTKDNKGCSDWSERTFTIPDNEAPKIESFDVNPKAPAWVNQANPRVTISWKASDTGGAHLKGVEVWRRTGTDETSWTKILTSVAPQEQDQWSGSTTNTPADDGIYWYRIDVVDGKENKTTATTPIKVQVDKTSPVAEIFSPAEQSTQGSPSFPITLGYKDSLSKLSTCSYQVRSHLLVTRDWTSSASCGEEDVISDTKDISVGPGLLCRDEGESGCTIFVKATDIAGNEDIASSSFGIQFARPTGSVEINKGESNPDFTGTTKVVLTLTCEGGCDEMRIANQFDALGTTEAQSFKNSLSWELSPEEGIKAVWVQFRAFGGLWSNQFADTIELVPSFIPGGPDVPDVVPPGGPAPTGIFGVVDRAVNVAFTALLIAASLFVLLAAFQFVTGGGNPEMISEARDKLIWAAVGIGTALVAKGAATILQKILLPSEGGGVAKDLCPPQVIQGIQNPLKTICFSGLLDSILNVIFTLSLIVVPFVVIYAGFLYVTGGGNPEQITKARDTLIWTAVGFGVILISKGLPFILKDILGI